MATALKHDFKPGDKWTADVGNAHARRINEHQSAIEELLAGGDLGNVTMDDVEDSTTIGKGLVRSDTQLQARQIIAAAAAAEVVYRADTTAAGYGFVDNDPTLGANSAFKLATQQAVRQYVLSRFTAMSGAANGFAPLDGNSLIPAVYLPSYVDDVIESPSLAALSLTPGVAGKIYVTLNDNRVYRWSGSVFVEISASPGSTDAVPEGASNLYFTNARADARADLRVAAGITGKADKTTTISAGTGLTGGGDLSGNRSLSVAYGNTAGTAAQGDDPRLSNARPPTTHTHNVVIPIEYEVHATYGTRALGWGDNTMGFMVPSAFTLTGVVFRGETADASGSSTVEIRKNGTQMASTVKTITAANQWNYDADIIITGLSESLVAGDILRPYISAVGTTPGKGLSVTLIGTKTVVTS